MKESLKIIRKNSFSNDSGRVAWESPSNIALIKYWGKHGKQMPANPSLSFTLSESLSRTSLEYEEAENKGSVSLEFHFDNQRNEAFEARIQKYLDGLSEILPWLKSHKLVISSENTFPHSSGIASSASGMSALALCLTDVTNTLGEKKLSDQQFMRFASYLSRLGSGSACRSIYGGYTIWGKTKNVKKSSDLYAIPLAEEDIHHDFREMCDDILIVEKGQKSVSSSAGHGLMKGHPFASRRFKLAHHRLSDMVNILKSGDMQELLEITESEALMLHSMMMTSKPYYILFKPNSLSIVNEIWEFRRETSIPVFFTLDAGANVHLLYPRSVEDKVKDFRDNVLLEYCEKKEYLCDRLGKGPNRI
jgi:diphosphomevalonate decarboxylase